MTYMSNVLGTLVPIADVTQLAHSKGSPVFVDGAQSAVHMAVDVQEIDVDFFAFTRHKVFGPSGIGVWYGKKGWLSNLHRSFGAVK